MGVSQCICPKGVAKDMLGNVDARDLVQMSGGRMTKQPGVEFFIDAHAIGGCSEDVLKGSRRYSFFSLGY